MKYAKTAAGQQALKERSAQLTPRQRSAMILFDGKKTLDQVMVAVAGLGFSMIDMEHLLALGYLALAEGASPPAIPPPVMASMPPVAPASAGGVAAAPPLNKSELFSQAWPIATRLTAMLGLRGFRLNLAVEAASGYDELLALLPRITEAMGPEKVRELREALRA
jgi:hypothetical protein